MENKYNDIWDLAYKYLKEWLNKDFIIHTEWVVNSMQMILKYEKWDHNILIPAAILHDVWWAKVPTEFQKTKDKEKKLIGMQLHIKYAPKIIKNILNDLNYEWSNIKEIIEIVKAHKFKRPKNLNKQLLIDADQLSDSLEKQFYSDVNSFNISPLELYNIRLNNNKFYTETAKNIFKDEMNKRKIEIEELLLSDQ